jgi:hypothetical protein
VTEADANEAISQHWNSAWLAAHGPLTADPVACIIEGGIGDTSTEWVWFKIDHGNSALQTLDGQQRQRTGLLVAEIHTSVIGTRRVSELVDDVREILENQEIQFGGECIWTEAASAPGRSDGAWRVRLVTVPFRWYG